MKQTKHQQHISREGTDKCELGGTYKAVGQTKFNTTMKLSLL